MRRPALWLALLTVLVYAPGLGGDFVYDDHFLLVDNPWLAKGSFRDALTINYWPLPPYNWRSVNYRPMGILGHLVLYGIFGLSPFAFHAASILLHAAATVAFFFLLKGLRFRIGVATAAAALFAVHPLHVESVAWMSQLTEVMAGAGVLAALAFFVYNRRGLSICAAAVAVFSKEPALVLPALVFLLAAQKSPERAWVRSSLRASLPYALLVIGWLAARILLLPQLPWSHLAVAAGKGVAIMAAAAAHYFRVLLLPWPLAVHYQLPGGWGMLLGGVVAAGWFWLAFGGPGKRRRPGCVPSEAQPQPACCLRHGLRVALTLAGLPLLLPLASAPMLNYWLRVQDRYTYVAVAGVCLAAVLLLSRLPRPGFVLACFVLLAAGTLGTLRLVRVWGSSETLWTHTLVVNPSSVTASLALGSTLSLEGRFAEAERVFRQALVYNPGHPTLLQHAFWARRSQTVLGGPAFFPRQQLGQ